MVQILLLVTLFLAGKEEPVQHLQEQPNMDACEAAAHKYNVAKIPDNAIWASAACIRAKPQLDGNPT